MEKDPAPFVPLSTCPGCAGCAQSCAQTSRLILHFGGEQDGRTQATSCSQPRDRNSSKSGILVSPLPSPNTVIPPVPQSLVSTWRDPLWEQELAPVDVPAFPERVLPADHLVEQDAQGPDRCCLAVVAFEAEPLWRAVGQCSYGIQTELIRWMLPAPRPSPQPPWECGACPSGTRCDPLPSRRHLTLVYKLWVVEEAAGAQEGSGSPGKAQPLHARCPS